MDAEQLAAKLIRLYPDADPFALDGEDLSRAVRDAGADADNDALVSAALVAWEGLLG